MSQYNLRYRNTPIPVQIELSDIDFMSTIMGDSQPTPAQRQVDASDDESSDNESQHGSDVGGDVSSEQNSSTTDQANKDSDQGASSGAITQDKINQAILDQLSAIGSRLEKLEKTKTGKKTNDPQKIKGKSGAKTTKRSKTGTETNSVESQATEHSTSAHVHADNTPLPSLISIRQNNDIQRQIEQRIRELSNQSSSTEKLKSMRGWRSTFPLKTGSDGPKNLCQLVAKKKEFLMIT